MPIDKPNDSNKENDLPNDQSTSSTLSGSPNVINLGKAVIRKVLSILPKSNTNKANKSISLGFSDCTIFCRNLTIFDFKLNADKTIPSKIAKLLIEQKKFKYTIESGNFKISLHEIINNQKIKNYQLVKELQSYDHRQLNQENLCVFDLNKLNKTLTLDTLIMNNDSTTIGINLKDFKIGPYTLGDNNSISIELLNFLSQFDLTIAILGQQVYLSGKNILNAMSSDINERAFEHYYENHIILPIPKLGGAIFPCTKARKMILHNLLFDASVELSEAANQFFANQGIDIVRVNGYFNCEIEKIKLSEIAVYKFANANYLSLIPNSRKVISLKTLNLGCLKVNLNDSIPQCIIEYYEAYGFKLSQHAEQFKVEGQDSLPIYPAKFWPGLYNLSARYLLNKLQPELALKALEISSSKIFKHDGLTFYANQFSKLSQEFIRTQGYELLSMNQHFIVAKMKNNIKKYSQEVYNFAIHNNFELDWPKKKNLLLDELAIGITTLSQNMPLTPRTAEIFFKHEIIASQNNGLLKFTGINNKFPILTRDLSDELGQYKKIQGQEAERLASIRCIKKI